MALLSEIRIRNVEVDGKTYVAHDYVAPVCTSIRGDAQADIAEVAEKLNEKVPATVLFSGRQVGEGFIFTAILIMAIQSRYTWGCADNNAQEAIKNYFR